MSKKLKIFTFSIIHLQVKETYDIKISFISLNYDKIISINQALDIIFYIKIQIVCYNYRNILQFNL